MKADRLIIAGILVAGAVALFTAGAAASSSSSGMPPASWHPELVDPIERRFVWSELQSRSGAEILADAPHYAAIIVSRPDGTEARLTALALSVLAAEATLKAGAGK